MEAVWRQRRAGTREAAVKGGCQGQWWRQWHVHTTGQQQRAVVVACWRPVDMASFPCSPTVRTYLVLCPYRADLRTSMGLSRSQEASGEVVLEHGC